MRIQKLFHVWAWIHLAITMWKIANFHMDFAFYWFDMVGLVMAHLNYLTLVIFLRYFDHSYLIPCVIMDPFTKNHVESCWFPYGFSIILVWYGRYSNGLLKLSHFSYFLKIFWPFKYDSMCEHGYIYQKPCGKLLISIWILHSTGLIW